jgi:DNA-binding NtrC family response regulator
VTQLLTSDEKSKVREPLVSKGRILIVDDDRFFTKVLKIILTGEAFEVSAAANLKEARALLGQNHFDIIISDLRIPDGNDGLALLQELRAKGDLVPFIMLTGYGEVENYMVAMNAGASDYLNKPIQAEELMAVIHRCLRFRNHHP